MPVSMKSLGIDRLSADDRLRLLDEIWVSLEEGDEVALPAWQEEELTRRLAALRADPKTGSSWDEVEARLMGRDR